MKKLFFCALAAIVSLQVASAQKRGEMYVGGSLGVTTASASIDGVSASAYGANGYGFATGLKFGAFEFRPASHCGISFSLLSLQYTYLSYSSGGYSASGNNVQFDFGVSPTIGFKYYF